MHICIYTYYTLFELVHKNCVVFFLESSLFAQCFNVLLFSVGEEADDADLEAPKIYEPIPSLDFLAERLKSYQELYNESIRGAKMDLVFFKASWMGFSLLFQMFHDIGYFSLWYDLGMQVKE